MALSLGFGLTKNPNECRDFRLKKVTSTSAFYSFSASEIGITLPFSFNSFNYLGKKNPDLKKPGFGSILVYLISSKVLHSLE